MKIRKVFETTADQMKIGDDIPYLKKWNQERLANNEKLPTNDINLANKAYNSITGEFENEAYIQEIFVTKKSKIFGVEDFINELKTNLLSELESYISKIPNYLQGFILIGESEELYHELLQEFNGLFVVLCEESYILFYIEDYRDVDTENENIIDQKTHW